MDITNLLIIIVGDYFLLNQNYRMLLTLMIPWILSKIQTIEIGFLAKYFYSNDKKYYFKIHNGMDVDLYHNLIDFLSDYFKENIMKNNISNLDICSSKEIYQLVDIDYNIKYKNTNFTVRRNQEKITDNYLDKYCSIWCSNITDMYDFINYLETYERKYIKDTGEFIKIYNVNTTDSKLVNKIDQSINCNPFIDKNVIELLYKDLDTFISSKQEYLDNQKTYKRTYLFEGLPGTGKTNLIKHLAVKYKRDIYYLQMDTFTNGMDLYKTILKTNNNSIIVLEDFACKEEHIDPKQKKILKKDMINILDGMLSPFNNHIIIMTTNNVEHIDPVLIRPGRIDYRINFTYATREQIQQIIDKKDLEFSEKIINKYVGKATIAEIIYKIETNTFI
jgi:hypothetical protein